MKRSMESRTTLYPWRCFTASRRLDFRRAISRKPRTSSLKSRTGLTKGNRFGCLFETAPGYYQTFTWYPYMWQGGGEIATPEGKHSAFASPVTVQAPRFWQDAIQQNVAPRNMLGTGGWDPIANLASGFCAMQNLDIWGVSNLRDNAKDFQYGVFPFPFTSKRPERNFFGGWAFVADAEGKNPRGSGRDIPRTEVTNEAFASLVGSAAGYCSLPG